MGGKGNIPVLSKAGAGAAALFAGDVGAGKPVIKPFN